MTTEFEENLMNILDIDEIRDDIILSELPEFDSLAILSIISIISSMYNKNVSAQNIKDAKTIKGLKELVK